MTTIPNVQIPAVLPDEATEAARVYNAEGTEIRTALEQAERILKDVEKARKEHRITPEDVDREAKARRDRLVLASREQSWIDRRADIARDIQAALMKERDRATELLNKREAELQKLARELGFGDETAEAMVREDSTLDKFRDLFSYRFEDWGKDGITKRKGELDLILS